MIILDVGHRYQLLSLDGNHKQILQFVKRFDKNNPDAFPRNKNRNPGTTCQDIIRCLLNRMRYLNNQIPCVEDDLIINNLHQCLFLLESRAAARHGLKLLINKPDELEFIPLCNKCGHTICHCKNIL